MFDGIAESVQRSHPWITAPTEHQSGGRTRTDQLVVHDVGGHAYEGEIATSLPNDLVTRGHGDQVRETFERHSVAVVNVFGDGLAQRGDGGHAISPVGRTEEYRRRR